jgi:cobalt/nickel transport system permease protein
LTGQNQTVPEWLIAQSPGVFTKKSGAHLLRKTLTAFSGVVLTEFLSAKYAKKSGLLQSLHPATRLYILLFFAVLSSLLSSLPALAAEALVAVFYAAQSGPPLRDFFRRVWGYLPPLLFVISLPAATSLFSKGPPLFYIFPSSPIGAGSLCFTAAGLLSALRLGLRCGVSLSFCYLLFITTPMAELEKTLLAARLPQLFVSVLGMTYRYIFVLTLTARNMVEARLLRTVGRLDAASGRRFFAHGVATVFIKSQALGSDVYDAMCCRCYTGRAVSLQNLRLMPQDFIFIAGNAIISTIILLGAYLF